MGRIRRAKQAAEARRIALICIRYREDFWAGLAAVDLSSIPERYLANVQWQMRHLLVRSKR